MRDIVGEGGGGGSSLRNMPIFMGELRATRQVADVLDDDAIVSRYIFCVDNLKI